MAVEISVGPPVITISHGHTFLVSEFDGSIANASDQGLYCRDTRYVSHYQLYINGKPWTLLNSGANAYYASRVYLVNPEIHTEVGVLAPAVLGVVVNRVVSAGLHEHLDIRYYSAEAVHF